MMYYAMGIIFLLCLVLAMAEHIKRKKCEDALEKLDKEYTRELGARIALDQENADMKRELDRERDQSQEIRKLHENTRRLKHDMKNHILVISSYLNANEPEKARGYLSTILDQLNKIYTYIETGNAILNYLINTKLESARQQQITIKAEIENLPFDRLASVDFSSLLSNMLDNAVEASQKERDREIHVRIVKKRGYDTILVKNRISASVLSNNPSLSSTKPPNEVHGYGVRQIRNISIQYDGMADFYEEDGFFCAYVMLPA